MRARVDLIQPTKVLHQALDLEHRVTIVADERQRCVQQVLVEVVDHVFDLIARFLHEGAISEYLRPAGPGIGCRKVLLDEEPQFQCTNCP